MKTSYIIGIDIGGTNTDAVLVDSDENIISAVKTTTTEDISEGFANVVQQLLIMADVDPRAIEGIFLGTTHATNALLQKKDLYRVGAIRIAGHKPDTLPVGYTWPTDLKNAIIVAEETIGGGLECHGNSLTPFCKIEARKAIKTLLAKGAESIAIVGVFSPLSGKEESDVATLIHEIAGSDFPISLSHEIGGIGFIERENSTLLNASLKRVMKHGFSNLQIACHKLNLLCPLMITQNDGSLIDLKRAVDYPVLTISAGPTNSFIGGCRLAKKDNAIVVDIGGTSTDVGLVLRGFPIRSLNKSNIGGVSLNFPMPDVLSIALGGGSIIKKNTAEVIIGPHSIGKAIERSIAFGGNELTLTDVALAMGHMEISGADTTSIPLQSSETGPIFERVKAKIDHLVQKMQGEHNDLPVILVGGGAALLPISLLQKQHLIPEHFNVANAYGAALAEISGTIDTVVSLKDREKVLEELHTQAKGKAIEQGANPKTLTLVDQQIIPYHYVPNQMARVVVRFCGKRSSALNLNKTEG